MCGKDFVDIAFYNYTTFFWNSKCYLAWMADVKNGGYGVCGSSFRISISADMAGVQCLLRL